MKMESLSLGKVFFFAVPFVSIMGRDLFTLDGIYVVLPSLEFWQKQNASCINGRKRGL